MESELETKERMHVFLEVRNVMGTQNQREDLTYINS